jgi:transcriptional regulator
MYSPKHYIENREDLVHEVLRDYSFATMISVSNNEPIISHLPVVFDAERNILMSHCAKANPHWKHFHNENPVTVIFNGPHAYVSPAWYQPDPDNVPTWNYVSVHISGAAKIIEDNQEAWLIMNKLVNHYENYYQTGWSLPPEPNEELNRDIQHGIVVFEISISKINAKFKLSQKQNPQDRNSVIENLPRYSGEQGKRLSDFMKRV